VIIERLFEIEFEPSLYHDQINTEMNNLNYKNDIVHASQREVSVNKRADKELPFRERQCQKWN
jgi:hypothetical protein